MEVVWSVGALAVFIWTLRWMLPRALRERDPLAIACAVLIALLTLAGLLLIGVPARSAGASGEIPGTLLSTPEPRPDGFALQSADGGFRRRHVAAAV